MINYIEKGIGLHIKISDSGHYLHQVDGVWESDNDVAVQAIIDNYTLEEAQDYVVSKIDLLAKEKRDKVVASVSPAEMASWAIKRTEAINFAGNPIEAPTLAIEATARGVALAALVDKVLAKSTLLSNLEAQIAGVSGKHSDAVRASITFQSVLSYDYSTDWPI